MSSNTYRTKNDSLGPIQVPANVFYGIHSLRARENFPDQTALHLEWYKALGSDTNSEILDERELHRLFNGFIVQCMAGFGKTIILSEQKYATGF